MSENNQFIFPVNPLRFSQQTIIIEETNQNEKNNTQASENNQFNFQTNDDRLCLKETRIKNEYYLQQEEIFSNAQNQHYQIRGDILNLMVSYLAISHPQLKLVQGLIKKMIKTKVTFNEYEEALQNRRKLLDPVSYKMIAIIISTQQGQILNENDQVFRDAGIRYFGLTTKKCLIKETLKIECSFYCKEDIFKAIHFIKTNYIISQCEITKKSVKNMESADTFNKEFTQYLNNSKNQQINQQSDLIIINQQSQQQQSASKQLNEQLVQQQKVLQQKIEQLNVQVCQIESEKLSYQKQLQATIEQQKIEFQKIGQLKSELNNLQQQKEEQQNVIQQITEQQKSEYQKLEQIRLEQQKITVQNQKEYQKYDSQSSQLQNKQQQNSSINKGDCLLYSIQQKELENYFGQKKDQENQQKKELKKDSPQQQKDSQNMSNQQHDQQKNVKQQKEQQYYLIQNNLHQELNSQQIQNKEKINLKIEEKQIFNSNQVPQQEKLNISNQNKHQYIIQPSLKNQNDQQMRNKEAQQYEQKQKTDFKFNEYSSIYDQLQIKQEHQDLQQNASESFSLSTQNIDEKPDNYYDDINQVDLHQLKEVQKMLISANDKIQSILQSSQKQQSKFLKKKIKRSNKLNFESMEEELDYKQKV